MDIRFVYILFTLGIVQCKLINLKCNDIKKFVDGHNARRLQLAEGKVPGQPAAATMNAMVWDKDLASKAAKWASRNQYGHNPDKTIDSRMFQKTGENIYKFSVTDPNYAFDPDMALDSWFKEYKDFTYKRIAFSDFNGPADIGHYTQMVWSGTTHVGCAMSQYKTGKWNNFYVVCNYGPPGNYIGEAPYEKGRPTKHLTCSGDCSRLYGDSC